jgi:hypothetical protein
MKTKSLITLVLFISLLSSCDDKNEGDLFVDIYNNSSFTIDNIVLSSGYDNMDEAAVYNYTIYISESLESGESSLGNKIKIDKNVGVFEAVKITFNIADSTYTKEDAFLYSYTHQNGSYDPGTDESFEITVNGDDEKAIRISMKD